MAANDLKPNPCKSLENVGVVVEVERERERTAIPSFFGRKFKFKKKSQKCLRSSSMGQFSKKHVSMVFKF